MTGLQYFFRMGVEEPLALNSFYLWILLIIGIYWAMKTKVTDTKISVMIMIGIAFQVVLMAWYLQDFSFFIQEGLPLYHCRIATIGLAIMWWLKKEKALRILAFLGLIGATMAYSIPDASPYNWPHITLVTFVGYHFNLAILSTLLLRKTVRITLGFTEITRFIFILNAIIFAVDLMSGANYGYFMHLPKMLNWQLPPFVLWLGISILMSVTIFSCQNFVQRRLVKNPLPIEMIEVDHEK